jgi:hypothetical protein
MAERHLELSLEACFDLRTQPIDVHFVAVIRHEAENFLELVVFTSSELAQRAMCVSLFLAASGLGNEFVVGSSCRSFHHCIGRFCTAESLRRVATVQSAEISDP